jgi:hypothetical protein
MHMSHTMARLSAIAADPQTVIEPGSMVRLKQAGQIAHIRLPARVNHVSEFNAIFVRDGQLIFAPLAWLAVVS